MHMHLVIFCIPNPVVAEPTLPDGKSNFQLLSDFASRPALDELHGPLQRCAYTRRQKKMKVIGHQHKSMKLIRSFIAIVKQYFDEESALSLLGE